MKPQKVSKQRTYSPRITIVLQDCNLAGLKGRSSTTQARLICQGWHTGEELRVDSTGTKSSALL